MKHVFTLLVLMFIYSCRNSNNSGENTLENEKDLKSKEFSRIIPDTSKSSYAEKFGYRYYLRAKTLEKKLGLDDIENGTSEFQMRLWHISSWGNPQRGYVLQHIDSFWQVEMYEFSVNVETWDKTQLGQEQELKFLTKIPVTPKIISPFLLIDSLDIQGLWKYPSQTDMKDPWQYGGCTDKYAIIIELSDNKRYKNIFYQCPENYIDSNATFKKVVYIQKLLAKAFSK